MNLDEQFLEMTDKIRLIKLENENVIPPHSLKNLKTPEKSTTLAFFFVSDYKELYKEITKNLSFKFI